MSFVRKSSKAVIEKFKLPFRSFRKSPKVFGKVIFNYSLYNRYGLYTNDVLNDSLPVVRQALYRLPKVEKDERNFRLIRAMHLDMLGIILPREKWITFEQDLEYRYLEPYIHEIIAEKMEIHEFGCANYRESDWPE